MVDPTGERGSNASLRPPSPGGVLFARNLFLPADLGGNRYPFEVVSRLGRRGHPTTVVTPRLHGEFPPLPNVRYQHYPVSRRHAAATHITNVLAASVALRHLDSHGQPVALAGSYDSALALGLAGVVPRTPMVFLYHSEFYSEWVQALGVGPRALARRVVQAYMRAVERRVFRLSARIVAVSAFSARQIAARAPGARDRVRVVSTGVDTTYFAPAPDRGAVRQALGLPPGAALILGVGRLVAVKQFDRLLRAFARVRAQGLDAHLVIAGDGPELTRLTRLTSSLNLADRVLLAGYCDPPRLRGFMQAADLQVCSSAFENLSLALLEGLACGTPLLGTPGGGTPELVGALHPNLVLRDDRPETIAEGLLEWLPRREALRSFSARARALATERYDWERVVDRLEMVCAEVIRG